MDEEMEDSNEVEYTFTAVEIDLDYEYDAVRFFDFCREESAAEARQAELWFETAATYPPSRKSRLLLLTTSTFAFYEKTFFFFFFFGRGAWLRGGHLKPLGNFI